MRMRGDERNSDNRPVSRSQAPPVIGFARAAVASLFVGLCDPGLALDSLSTRFAGSGPFVAGDLLSMAMYDKWGRYSPESSNKCA